MPKKHISELIDYIMTHEREDFLEQCAEHDLNEIEGLYGADRSDFPNGLDSHIYWHAVRVSNQLERLNELTAELVRKVGDL